MAQQTTYSKTNGGSVDFGSVAIQRLRYPAAIPGAKTQLRMYLEALFDPDDVVELRPIECWTEAGTKRSRLVSEKRRWVTAEHCAEMHDELHSLNTQGVNIFVGVNPRESRGGTKDAIGVCRSVWVDLDHVTFDEARSRWEHILPPPSIAISSGHGYHAYWLLRKPYEVRERRSRERFETMLKSLYADLGADATNDVSRILRLPGTWNVKDCRNGKNPEPCVLVYCDPKRQYPIGTFRPWFEKASNPNAVRASSRREEPIRRFVADDGDVATALSRLDDEVSDRSRRDFGVVCHLLRLGHDPEAIWRLVHDRSKFATSGREYFDVTIKNAIRSLGA